MSSSKFPLFLSDTSFFIIDFEDEANEWPLEYGLDHSNGLVAVMSHGAQISTGIHTGLVNVEVCVLSQPPDALDLDGWDEVIEISFRAPAGHTYVRSMEDLPEESPLVTPN